MAKNVLSIASLACARGERLLFQNQTFSVKSGGLLYVQGDNGAGKTTLLRTICGLFEAQAGSVNWNYQETKTLAEEYLGQVLYIGHHTGIKEELTAIENLQFSIALKGIHVSREQVLTALTHLGLEHCADLPTRVLSQGQKKRVALARLWLEQSALWVLDEPFTSLDIHVIEELTEWIERYVKEGGIVVMTSHQLPKFDPVIVQHLRLH